MTSQLDFDCDVKGSVRLIYPTLLSHTAEHRNLISGAEYFGTGHGLMSP